MCGVTGPGAGSPASPPGTETAPRGRKLPRKGARGAAATPRHARRRGSSIRPALSAKKNELSMRSWRRGSACGPKKFAMQTLSLSPEVGTAHRTPFAGSPASAQPCRHWLSTQLARWAGLPSSRTQLPRKPGGASAGGAPAPPGCASQRRPAWHAAACALAP
jgi:hypothetical protein